MSAHSTKALFESKKVSFSPIGLQGKTQKMVNVGKDICGVLLWQYGNGDALVRTETAVWYVPAHSWKALCEFGLN